jgi:hypothetical protein
MCVIMTNVCVQSSKCEILHYDFVKYEDRITQHLSTVCLLHLLHYVSVKLYGHHPAKTCNKYNEHTVLKCCVI